MSWFPHVSISIVQQDSTHFASPWFTLPLRSKNRKTSSLHFSPVLLGTATLPFHWGCLSTGRKIHFPLTTDFLCLELLDLKPEDLGADPRCLVLFWALSEWSGSFEPTCQCSKWQTCKAWAEGRCYINTFPQIPVTWPQSYQTVTTSLCGRYWLGQKLKKDLPLNPVE